LIEHPSQTVPLTGVELAARTERLLFAYEQQEDLTRKLTEATETIAQLQKTIAEFQTTIAKSQKPVVEQDLRAIVEKAEAARYAPPLVFQSQDALNDIGTSIEDACLL
jgi:peptidoglycan hydrolase CwlO-like protein